MAESLNELVADTSSLKRYIVRFKSWNSTLLTEETHYYSDHGIATRPEEAPPNAYFPGRIHRPLTFSRSMFDGNNVGGRSLPGFGEIVLNNKDDELDFILNNHLDGRDCDLFIGGENDRWSDYFLIFSGIIDAIDAQEDTLSLRVQSIAGKMDQVFHQAVYGTSEEDDIEGKPIPECHGQVFNITPVLTDSTGYVYQVHNGQIESIDAVYDEGVLKTVTTDYTVNLTTGKIDFVAAPTGAVTVDLKGSKEGGVYNNKVGDIIQRIAGYRGITVFETGVFAALNTAFPAIVGVYVSEQVSTLSVIDFLINSAGGFYGFTRIGEMTVGQLTAPTTSTTLLGDNGIRNVTNLGVERCNELRVTDPAIGAVVATDIYPNFWAPNSNWYDIHDITSVGVDDGFDYIEVRLNGTPSGDMRISFETARTNHIPNSEDLTAAAWVKTATNITADDAIFVDGALVADKVLHTLTTADVTDLAVMTPGSSPVVASIHVKKGEHRWYLLKLASGADTNTVWFDAQIGTIGANSQGGSVTHISSGVADEDASWYRLWHASVGYGGAVDLTFSQVDGDSSTTAVVGSVGHVSGVQLKEGTDDRTSYIKTTGVAVTGAIIGAAKDSIWSESVYLKLISGNFTNIDAVRLVFDEWPNGGTTVGTVHTGSSITVTGTRTRFSYAGEVITDATTKTLDPYLELTHTAGAVDVTFRIYRPQFEEGRTVTSFMEGGTCDVLEAGDDMGATIPDPVPTIPRALTFQRGGESSSGTPVNGPNTYMHRTPSVTGNRRIMTFATWFRRHNIHSDNEYLWWAISGGHPTFDEDSYFGFIADTNRIRVAMKTIPSYYRADTTTAFTSETAWTHLVIAIDTTQGTDTNRIKVWVNNVQETMIEVANGFPTQNFDSHFNRQDTHYLGRREFNVDHLNAVMADTYWIDGLALSPSDFTTWTGTAWVPKTYTGVYGTNGFHVDYADNSTVSDLGTDVSGTGNNLSVVNFLTTDQTSNDLPTSPVEAV